MYVGGEGHGGGAVSSALRQGRSRSRHRRLCVYIHGRSRAAPSPLVLPSTIVIASAALNLAFKPVRFGSLVLWWHSPPAPHCVWRLLSSTKTARTISEMDGNVRDAQQSLKAFPARRDNAFGCQVQLSVARLELPSCCSRLDIFAMAFLNVTARIV